MKNKEFYKLLKKNKFKPNSGFTLTELLVGLIMSTIVIAGLGWGLMQILTITKTETSKVTSRNETSRAFNFISDEIKAAQSMEANESPTSYISNTDLAAIAPDFALPTGAKVKLAMQVPGVDQRIIYYVAPSTGTWKKPLTIYRWGPNLNANGSYTGANSPGDWQYEALIDGVSNEPQSVTCDVNGDGTLESFTYEGFFACVEDNDGDGVVETADSNNDGVVDSADTATIDVNGDGITDDDDLDMNEDGVLDAGDNADEDGMSITAQLYFAADTQKGLYKTDSQVVARSRVAPLRKPELTEKKLLEVESLPFNYGRNINNSSNTPCWTVRNDFGQGNDPTARPGSGNELTNMMTWIHEDNRQPQPLNIDPSQPLTIVTSAFGGRNPQCLARGNEYKRIWDSASSEYRYVDSAGNAIDPETDDGTARLNTDGSEEIHTYEHKIWHTIDFSNPDTFNGTGSNVGSNVDRNPTEDYSDGTRSTSPTEGSDSGAGDVRIFKNGDSIDSIPSYEGYDQDNTSNPDGNRDQDSLKQLIESKYVDENGKIKLEENQRIIVFEIGQDRAGTEANPNPGFDLQDAMFIMTSDAFLQSSEDGGYENQ